MNKFRQVWIGLGKFERAGNAANCSSLAYSLLVSDGIHKIAEPSVSLKFIVLAKEKENEILMKKAHNNPRF